MIAADVSSDLVFGSAARITRWRPPNVIGIRNCLDGISGFVKFHEAKAFRSVTGAVARNDDVRYCPVLRHQLGQLIFQAVERKISDEHL